MAALQNTGRSRRLCHRALILAALFGLAIILLHFEQISIPEAVHPATLFALGEGESQDPENSKDKNQNLGADPNSLAAAEAGPEESQKSSDSPSLTLPASGKPALVSGSGNASHSATASRTVSLSLQGFLETCQANDTTSVSINRWMGRLGNRLWQVLIAIKMAQASGRRIVRFPADGLEDRVFRWKNPLKLASHRQSECNFQTRADDRYTCLFLFFDRCRTTVAERRDLLQTYVLPQVIPELYSECRSGTDQRVTLHFRNGDVATHFGGSSLAGNHDQPPCLYYHRVIDTGYNGKPFKEIQLVFSKEEPKNPCIAEIMERHRDKTIIPPLGTVRGDTCMLLKAKNLAVTMSSMSTTLKMLNTKLKRLFYVNALQEKKGLHFEMFDFEHNEVCEAFPRAVGYDVLPFNFSKASDYFSHFPPHLLKTLTCP